MQQSPHIAVVGSGPATVFLLLFYPSKGLNLYRFLFLKAQKLRVKELLFEKKTAAPHYFLI